MLSTHPSTQDAGQLATAGQRYCVGIVGAGNVGCYFGAHLCQDSALDVKFFGRETMALELAAHGLCAISVDKQNYFAQPVAFYSALNSLIECDVVLLTVKATALLAMIAQLKRFLRPDVPVIALQNGIGIAQMLAQDLPNPILRALVPFAISKGNAGQFCRSTDGNISWQQNDFAVVNYLISVCNRLQLKVELHTDIIAAEYGQLLPALNDAINVLSQIPLQQQWRSADYRHLLAAAMQEWLKVCTAAGIATQPCCGVPNRLLPFLLRLPTRMFSMLLGRRLNIEAPGHSAMWEQLQAKKPTEIMFLNAAVVRMAQRYAIAAPVNQLLTDWIKRAEAGETDFPSARALLAQAGKR
ncbi:hypothetical protein MN202_11300 [Rheinheimera muenzenbergensis]|uniref:2-dehydropantoate 2-reductase n=1 Tax=Rheinheimera muenzenbergensis TaxID=1193628 RepID=A0ABU8C7B4_9GAMM